MTQNLLEHKDIVKKTNYHPQDPIVTVLCAVEELLEFSDITGMSYTNLQALNIAYVIIHRMGKFVLVIYEWNCMTKSQNTWVRF